MAEVHEKLVPVVSAAEAERMLILRMAERFKEINPEVAKRVDDAAAQITGKVWATKVFSDSDPAVGSARARPAIHLESEAGQAKTATVRAAAVKFCEITGMNFVENPPEHYMPNKQDFYFFTTNMIGQYNASEAGGLPIRIQLGGERDAESLISELYARVDSAYSVISKGKTASQRQFEYGGLDAIEVSIDLDNPAAAGAIANTQVSWLASSLEGSGSKLKILRDGQEPDEQAFSVRVEKSAKSVTLTYFEPKQEIRAKSAMGKLPNIAWAKASSAGASLMFIDEVDKISPAIRHLLLEIAQSGRVSGTANLGEHYMVVMAGNLGDRGSVNDFNDSASYGTVAETTRVLTYRMVVTPEEWANYVEANYPNSDNGHFPSFIRAFGDQKGIFRPDFENQHFDPNNPCSNSRSLENAMKVVKTYFAMADEAGVTRDEVMDVVSRDTLAAIGEPATSAFLSHCSAMEMMAVPLAQHIMASKSESADDILSRPLSFAAAEGRDILELFSEKTEGYSYVSPEAQHFAHRFKEALVGQALRSIGAAEDLESRTLAASKCIAGLGILRGEQVNAGVARLSERMKTTLEHEDGAWESVMTDAIVRGTGSGFYGDADLSDKENEALIKEVRSDLIQVCTGVSVMREAKARQRKLTT